MPICIPTGEDRLLQVAISQTQILDKPPLYGGSSDEQLPLEEEGEPTIIIPINREKDIKIFNTEEDATFLVIVHINDNYSTYVSTAIRHYKKYFVGLRGGEVIEDPEYPGHHLLIVPYLGSEDPTDVPDLLLWGNNYYEVLGQIIEDPELNQKVTDCYTVFDFSTKGNSYFRKVDKAQKGRDLNDRLNRELQEKENITVLDTTSLSHKSSIGWARGYPILLIMNGLSGKPSEKETPIYWMDADGSYERGALPYTTYIYNHNPTIQSIIFLQRLAMSLRVTPERYINHAIEQLNRVNDFPGPRGENRSIPIGGPQISTRLSLYIGDHDFKVGGKSFKMNIHDAMMSRKLNEDFFISNVLQNIFDRRELIMVPRAVKIATRLEERTAITAIVGDSGNPHLVFLEYYGSYKDLLNKTAQSLEIDIPESESDIPDIHTFINIIKVHLDNHQLELLEMYKDMELVLLNESKNNIDINGYEEGIFINALQRVILKLRLDELGIKDSPL